MTESIVTLAAQLASRIKHAFAVGRAEGQGLVEYGLVILLVSIAAIGALGTFGGGLTGLYGQIVSRLPF